LCTVQLDLPTSRSWTPFTIMPYACVWVHSGLLQQSVCVQATEPPLALRRKELALQYCLKLSANLNNPAYNAVFDSKFKTQFGKSSTSAGGGALYGTTARSGLGRSGVKINATAAPSSVATPGSEAAPSLMSMRSKRLRHREWKRGWRTNRPQDRHPGLDSPTRRHISNVHTEIGNGLVLGQSQCALHTAH